MKYITEAQVTKLHNILSEKKQNAEISISKTLAKMLGVKTDIRIDALLRICKVSRFENITQAQVKYLLAKIRKLPAKRINCREEFELCYLRHKYLRKIKKKPTYQEMQPYLKIAARFANKTFFAYKNLFYLVGLEQEDLVSIANIHLVSFLGLFSLKKMPEKYKEFINMYENVNGYTPTKDEILNKDKSSFTLFLKQRMEDVVRICRQKGKNIKGIPVDGHYYYMGSSKPPTALQVLIKDYEKLGFHKIDGAFFRAICKQAKPDYNMMFKFEGKWYVAVPLYGGNLKIYDFNGANLNPYDNMHNKTPEEYYFTLEDYKILENNRKEFESFSPEDKRTILMNFIEDSRSDPEFQEEIKTARKFLKRLA